jgi:hypothetical protein
MFGRGEERNAPVKLGENYRDSITGFEGIATWRAEYLHGCVRVGLEAGKDGKVEEFVFDEQRLTDAPAATSGGSRPAPPSRDVGAARGASRG